MRKFLSLFVVLLTTFVSAWADNNYLCFTNVDDKSINVKFNVDGAGTYTLPSIQYSTDKTSWTNYDFTSNAATNHTITLAAGEKVYFKAATTNSTFSTYTNSSNKSTITITSDGKVAASGNIMSLLDATCESKTISASGTFYQLFNGCSNLTSAPELPATSLAQGCYQSMFEDCISLTTLPALPASSLPATSYRYMFAGCVNLILNTTAPGTEWKIDATSVGNNALTGMFNRTGGTLTGTPTNGTTYYISSLHAVKLNSKGYATYSSDKPFKVNTQYYNTTDKAVKSVDVKAYKAKVNGEQIVLTEIPCGTSIPAGEGILLYTDDANSTGFAHFQWVSSADAITDNDLKATTTATDPIVAKPSYGTIWALGDGNEFLTYTADAFVANRAFLRTDVPAAKGMTLVFGDETTGVANIDASTSSAQAREGKYIENGRIIILKNGKKLNANGQHIK